MVEDSLVSCVEDLVWQEADSSSLLNSGAEGRVGGRGVQLTIRPPQDMPFSMASELGNLESFHLTEGRISPSLGTILSVQQTLAIPAHPGGVLGTWQ